MPGKGSKIIADDYNAIQKRVAAVLGTGGTDPVTDLADSTFGYGQSVSSSQVSQFAKISTNQWINLRNDLLRCRYHQNADVSAILTTPLASVTITESDRAQYLSVAENAITNRLATPPDTQIDVIPLVATNLSQWNTQVTQTITATFSNTTQARYFFNAGGSFRISSSRRNDDGDASYSLKNATWTTMLNSMGKISLSRETTSRDGTTGTTSNIGWSQLTTTDQLIFEQLAPGATYADNKFRIFAKTASAGTQIVFSIQWRDDSPNPNTTLYGLFGPYGVDEFVTGILTSTFEVLKPSGAFVSVTAPTTSQSGFGTVPSPPASTVYQISPSVTVMDEGTPVTFNIATANFGNGTLYWTNSGTIAGTDFTDGENSGSVTITGNIGSFTKSIVNDFTTEGTETIIIQLRTGSTSGPIVVTCATVSVLDSSKTLGYSITPDQFFATETTTVTWAVTTTNFPDGNLFWSNSGTADAADFSGGNNSGSVAIVSNSGTITLFPKPDLLTEGDETIIIDLRTGSTSGPIVATSLPVQLQDSSTTPPPIVIPPTPVPDPPPPPAGYSVSRVVDGLEVTYTITTTNFGSGALYWTNGGTTVAGDFTDGANFGTIGIVNNSATIIRTVRSDAEFFTDKTLIFRVHTGSNTGPVVATATTVTFAANATPPTPPAFEYTVTPASSTAFIGPTSDTTTAQFVINCQSGSGIVSVRKLFSDPSNTTTSADGGLGFSLSNPGTTFAIVNISCTGPFGANPAANYVYNFAVDSGSTTKAFLYTQGRYNETASVSPASGPLVDDGSGPPSFTPTFNLGGGFAGGTVTTNFGTSHVLNSSGNASFPFPIDNVGTFSVVFTFPSGNTRTVSVTATAYVPPPPPPDTGGG
jgi:hypothetical protein